MTDLPEPAPATDSLKRQLLLTWVLMGLLVFVLLLPSLKLWFNFGVSGDPRPVTPRGALADFEQTTVDLFNEVSPSVVYINTRQIVANPYRAFGSYREESGTGSGFVWDTQGHIVTNFHVIQEATDAQVVFFYQSSFTAELVGFSAEHDLAVLRISAPANLLRPVLIGSSHDLQVGQSVYAIGNPFGLNQTLTTGIISAKSRSIKSPSGDDINDVIQIDAAINPGNSGGPLMDSAGRLVGVNTAIYSPSGASAGIGFSIPVDVVNRVVPQIIQQGRYEPPKLGVYINEELNEMIKRATDIDGVAILQLEPGGPAEQVGLRGVKRTSRGLVAGDIVQAINNQPTSTVKDLQDILQQFQRGDTVTLTVFRAGDLFDVDLTLE